MKKYALITLLPLLIAAFMWSCQDKGPAGVVPVNIIRPPGQPCKVKPGKVLVDRGDLVWFKAKAVVPKEDVTIRIDEKVFGVYPIKLDSANGYQDTLRVLTGAPVGDIVYFVSLENEECHGDFSPPKMIIR